MEKKLSYPVLSWECEFPFNPPIVMLLRSTAFRSTKEALADYWMEYICHLKEISCWWFFCFLKVFIVLWFRCSYYCIFGVTIWVATLNYRGDNEELRVGVRRLARQQSSMPPSVISSQSMHLGVLATASHSITTQTRFVVYYKPRYFIRARCIQFICSSLFNI